MLSDIFCLGVCNGCTSVGCSWVSCFMHCTVHYIKKFSQHLVWLFINAVTQRQHYAKLWFKGIVHPNMKILSSFTHPQVVTNLYEFLCSAKHKGSKFIKITKFVIRLFWGTIDFHSRKKINTMEVNGAPELLCFPHSSEYLPLCSAEQRHSYRFGTTWGWVNDDRIFIFGWTIPLTAKTHC